MICFDEKSYSGFHFYDFDISMQIFMSGFKSYFIPGILIEHLSLCVTNIEWRKLHLFFITNGRINYQFMILSNHQRRQQGWKIRRLVQCSII